LNTIVAAGVLALACAAGSFLAHAQEVSKPVLLVASPGLKGQFGQTTLVAVPVGERHFGLILNRVTGVKLSTLFPGHAPSEKVAEPVYFGGPVMNEAVLAVLRRNPGKAALPLFGDLFVTVSAEAIDRIIEETPNEARYFVGFVGWQAGELAAEIERGVWYVADPDAGLVFRQDTSGMWEELVARYGKSRPGHMRTSAQSEFTRARED
jgi:putative transcriptional regulator